MLSDSPATAHIEITLCEVRPIRSKSVYALVDAILAISGVEITIKGVQARHVPGGGTSIHLPMYRDSDGAWRPAIAIPDELRDAIANLVLSHLIECGIAKPRASAGVPI